MDKIFVVATDAVSGFVVVIDSVADGLDCVSEEVVVVGNIFVVVTVVVVVVVVVAVVVVFVKVDEFEVVGNVVGNDITVDVIISDEREFVAAAGINNVVVFADMVVVAI